MFKVWACRPLWTCFVCKLWSMRSSLLQRSEENKAANKILLILLWCISIIWGKKISPLEFFEIEKIFCLISKELFQSDLLNSYRNFAKLLFFLFNNTTKHILNWAHLLQMQVWFSAGWVWDEWKHLCSSSSQAWLHFKPDSKLYEHI